MTKEQIAAVLEKARAEALSLPVPERIELVQELWESIGDHAVPDLTPEQIADYERRLAEHDADPSSAFDWQSVLAEVQAHLARTK